MNNKKKTKVLITSEIDSKHLKMLEEKCKIILRGRAVNSSSILDERRMIEVARENKDITILIVGADQITSNVLDEFDSLKLIECTRGNPINVDIKACTERGILVTNTPGRNANAVSEFTIALMICCARKIPQAYLSIKNRDCTVEQSFDRKNKKDVVWLHPSLKEHPYVKFRGFELDEKVLGLVGLGAIGLNVAEKARSFHMRVIAYDPYVSDEVFKKNHIEKVELNYLLKNADFISLHAKVTKETVNLIDKEELSMMKNTAYLINTARGALINQKALYEALLSKQIAGAALDVFEDEPLTSQNPLINLDNLILTPHIGGASSDVVRHHSKMAVKDIFSFLEGQPPINLVN
ncbi:MAG TPA: dihydrofolate reductase [Candidatus Atribacteria bacterium]|nr:dihydrofolate reductase [Candidatus Atribacteria bacterium]